jgi:hypothetical protein
MPSFRQEPIARCRAVDAMEQVPDVDISSILHHKSISLEVSPILKWRTGSEPLNPLSRKRVHCCSDLAKKYHFRGSSEEFFLHSPVAR